MNVEINDEMADIIVTKAIKEIYSSSFETLENTLNKKDFTGVYSFDYDDEVFSIIKELKALEFVLNIFGEKVSKSVISFLKDNNFEIYEIDKSMEELKIENKSLKIRNHILEEDLEELKDKIKNLF